MRLFFIETPGRTASIWMAQQFNRVPGIYCNHGVRVSLKQGIAAIKGDKEELRGADIENEILSRENGLKLIRTGRYRDFVDTLKDAARLSEPDLQPKAIGGVHGLKLGPTIEAELDASRVHVLRHPVTHLYSLARYVPSADRGDFLAEIEAHAGTRPFLRYFASTSGLEIEDIPTETLAILSKIPSLISNWPYLVNNRGLDVDVHLVEFERMVGDVNYLSSLICAVADLSGPDDPSRVRERVGPHMAQRLNHSTPVSSTVDSVLANWHEITRALVREWFVKHAEPMRLYREAGYTVVEDIDRFHDL